MSESWERRTFQALSAIAEQHGADPTVEGIVSRADATEGWRFGMLIVHSKMDPPELTVVTLGTERMGHAIVRLALDGLDVLGYKGTSHNAVSGIGGDPSDRYEQAISGVEFEAASPSDVAAQIVDDLRNFAPPRR